MSDEMQPGKTPFLARKQHPGYEPKAGSNQAEALKAYHAKAKPVHVPAGALKVGVNTANHKGGLVHHEVHYKDDCWGALTHEPASGSRPNTGTDGVVKPDYHTGHGRMYSKKERSSLMKAGKFSKDEIKHKETYGYATDNDPVISSQ